MNSQRKDAVNGEPLYGIGELSRHLKCSLRTLRFYEDKGMVAPQRDGSTRLYSKKDVTRVGLIRGWVSVGFTLAQVKVFLRHLDAGEHGILTSKLAAGLNRLESAARDKLRAIEDFKAMMKNGEYDLLQSRMPE
jgi:DNA-binding transcriptional MerR regulator